MRIDSDHELRLAVDAAHPSDNTESVSAGAELVYRRSVALRWGYQDAFQQDSEVGLTMGAGLQGDAGGRHYQPGQLANEEEAAHVTLQPGQAMTPAMARALGPPPVIGAVVGASGLSNTRETSSPWGDRSRPPMIGVVQSIW